MARFLVRRGDVLPGNIPWVVPVGVPLPDLAALAADHEFAVPLPGRQRHDSTFSMRRPSTSRRRPLCMIRAVCSPRGRLVQAGRKQQSRISYTSSRISLNARESPSIQRLQTYLRLPSRTLHTGSLLRTLRCPPSTIRLGESDVRYRWRRSLFPVRVAWRPGLSIGQGSP